MELIAAAVPVDEKTNSSPKTLLATIGLELTTYVARHKNYSFLDSNWNG